MYIYIYVASATCALYCRRLGMCIMSVCEMSELFVDDVLENGHDGVLMDGVPDAERQGGRLQPACKVGPRNGRVFAAVILREVAV